MTKEKPNSKKINDLDALSALTRSSNYAIPILDLNDRDEDGDPKLKQVPINLLQALFKNETNLAKVATSGKYGDLKNLPQLFSGEYADLSGKPNIPSRTSELQNDSGFLTEHQDISGKADTADLSAVATSGQYADLLGLPILLNGLTLFGVRAPIGTFYGDYQECVYEGAYATVPITNYEYTYVLENTLSKDLRDFQNGYDKTKYYYEFGLILVMCEETGTFVYYNHYIKQYRWKEETESWEKPFRGEYYRLSTNAHCVFKDPDDNQWKIRYCVSVGKHYSVFPIKLYFYSTYDVLTAYWPQ